MYWAKDRVIKPPIQPDLAEHLYINKSRSQEACISAVRHSELVNNKSTAESQAIMLEEDMDAAEGFKVEMNADAEEVEVMGDVEMMNNVGYFIPLLSLHIILTCYL